MMEASLPYAESPPLTSKSTPITTSNNNDKNNSNANNISKTTSKKVTSTTTIARRRRREILQLRRSSSAATTATAVAGFVATAISALNSPIVSGSSKRTSVEIGNSNDCNTPSKMRKLTIGEAGMIVATTHDIIVDTTNTGNKTNITTTPQKKKKDLIVDEDDDASTTSPKKEQNSNVSLTKQPYQVSKEEASALRREARRVRNRESAAASRAKIRHRIEDLEKEVMRWKTEAEKWKSMYEEVIKDD